MRVNKEWSASAIEPFTFLLLNFSVLPLCDSASGKLVDNLTVDQHSRSGTPRSGPSLSSEKDSAYLCNVRLCFLLVVHSPIPREADSFMQLEPWYEVAQFLNLICIGQV